MLSVPSDSQFAGLSFSDLFDVEEIQQIQDAFAESTGVASIITDVNGAPITRPSNFCRLCEKVIRCTDKGLKNCMHSDSVLGRLHPDGAVLQPCLSGGLWDAGASICIGDQHIANWLIGQVLTKDADLDKMMDYGREIGADETQFGEALKDVTRMPLEQFKRVADSLFLFARQLSRLAEQNVLQSREMAARQIAQEELAKHRDNLEELVRERTATLEKRTAQLSHANADLARARDAAEASSLAKSSFLANMSHEIRTPMTAIIGMTELVMDTKLTSEQREYLAVVNDSGEALLSVIDDILDFSRIEAGKLSLYPEIFDLQESLGDTMKSLSVRAHMKGLEVVCRISPEVPVAVVGDRVRLRQVVTNLVGNAIKFTDSGEILLEVRPESRIDNQLRLHFTVSDTGIGIPAEKCGEIFGSFEQVDISMRRRHGGTGLGLAISSKLVEMMDGRIWVESDLGKGSTFHFVVQFGLVEEEELGKAETTEPELLHGMRVLVVDDNATNCWILEEMLSKWGMAPSVTTDSSTTLERLRSAQQEGAPFKLVLTDAHMPHTDGFTLVGQIRADKEVGSVVILMLTSGGQPSDVSRCEQLDISSYLLKPIKQSELFDSIMMTLGIMDHESDDTPQVDAAPSGFGKLDVLLAEDSAVNQKLAVLVLERSGHRVTVANNGREAVAAVKSRDFDLVLMDVQMPEMDGLEATAAIRVMEQSTGTHVPIVAMTAHAMKGDREQCLANGMDGYVSKPVRREVLFAAIEEALVGGGSSVTGTAESAVSGVESDCFSWALAVETFQKSSELSEDTVQTLIQIMMEESSRLFEKAREAVAAGDLSGLVYAAHTLKGSASCLGESPVYHEAQRLETMARARQLDGAAEAMTALRREVDRMMVGLGNMT